MNFGQAFTYVFQDADWFKKIIIVALVALIPIIGQIVVLGLTVEVMRRVINNDPTPLPEFDFGGFLGKGFQALVVSIVYGLPLFIFYLPIMIVPIIGDATGNGDVMNYIMIATSCICGGLMVLYGILYAFLYPAALGKMVTGGSLGAAFRIGDVFALARKGLMPYLIAVLGVLVAGLITPFGVIACGVGVLVTMTYTAAVTGHFYAQAYKQASLL